MVVNNKIISRILLLVGLLGALAGCGLGASNQNIANNATNDLTLQSYINSLSYKPLSTTAKLQLDSKNTLVTGKLGNQQIFTALAPVTLASIEMNYYTDDHCESLSSVTTIGGSATAIPAGTYSTNDQSNYNLCNAYAGGCTAQLSAAQSATFKSIQYKYNYTNGASSASVCMYNPDKGYEALADYATPATPVACTSNSSCGYSESYGAQLLGIPAASTNSDSNYNYSCRVTGSLSNNITCWGTGSGGQMGNGQGVSSLPSQAFMPDGVTSFSQVSTGTTLSCGIANTGKIYCWGTGSSGQIGNGVNDNVNIPTSVTKPSGVDSFNAVSTNNNFSCALANTGQVYCWGVGISGQIGNSANSNVNVPTAVTMPSGVDSFNAVSTNTNFSCAIANTGKIYCWGTGSIGRIGNGANSNVNIPTSVTMPSGVESFSAVSTNSNFSCAIANNGNIYCWGTGSSGRIGNGANSNVNVPTAVTMPSGVESFTLVSTNTNFSCAIANTGKIYCWGTGTNGQIGNGANSNVNVPTSVTMPSGVDSFNAVSTNANFSCAIANTGKIYCWGTGSSGRIGNGANSSVNVPTAVTMPVGVESFTNVSTNTNFSCAIGNGKPYCWGTAGGHLGRGNEYFNTSTNIIVPSGVNSFNMVSTSGTNSCALASNGKPYCWGDGTNGQTGNGTNASTNLPTGVTMPAGVTSFSVVVTTSSFSCAIANNGQIYCWGTGTSGQIGNESNSSVNIPTAITTPNGVSSFSSISLGTNFSCAIANTGKIYCWGLGTTGQIGNGASLSVNLPTEVTMPAGVTSFKSISTNGASSCALANTGVVYCWGGGTSGQIGNGADLTVNIPTAVTMPSGVTSFSSISTNATLSCALANTGVVYCWGAGSNGRIGNGANDNVNIPTSVTMPSGVTSFRSVSTNDNFSCSLANTGVVYCWGSGVAGQIGNGASSNVSIPTAVTMPSGVTSFGYVSTSYRFSCAIAASGENAGKTYCWGAGTNGQIGNGANNDVNVPTLVQ